MAALVETGFDSLPSGGALVTIRLTGSRANSLEPGLLAALHDAFDAADGADVVRLTAAGRHFSTGGDVARFFEAAEGGRADSYAAGIVEQLHTLIVRMLTLPAIIVAGARGAITGGSVGLLAASDLVVLGDDAFLQPWYAEVGFAPDGGWTALLPDLVGAKRALAWQIDNTRIDAAEAVRLGLATRLVAGDALDAALDAEIAAIDGRHIASLKASKRLVWDEERIAAVTRRLEAEREAFRGEIGKDSVREGMRTFLEALAARE